MHVYIYVYNPVYTYFARLRRCRSRLQAAEKHIHVITNHRRLHQTPTPEEISQNSALQSFNPANLVASCLLRIFVSANHRRRHQTHTPHGISQKSSLYSFYRVYLVACWFVRISVVSNHRHLLQTHPSKKFSRVCSCTEFVCVQGVLRVGACD